ncbi:hypothetical protein HHX48_07325 [Salinimonas sp. HHU 13199]|uniref:Uncharacterized protein n=1 Tax=Salinimonas profundi TaxID=2729140 RepID=A0ABR8LH19_9ALTE|nr:hypothetical protein [Salinimonas profundi]MBD3585539.1 hypothetical protein [Salinimonas profundi]
MEDVPALSIEKVTMEQAEVLLSNLLALADREEEKFLIPFFGIVVTLEAIKNLLASKGFQ